MYLLSTVFVFRNCFASRWNLIGITIFINVLMKGSVFTLVNSIFMIPTAHEGTILMHCCSAKSMLYNIVNTFYSNCFGMPGRSILLC
jgi:hypothetical protein